MGQKLTAKQQRFVAEYLVDLNATQAAIRAGYKEKTAGQTGAENLKKPQIQDAIKRANEQRLKKASISADRVLQELARIAFSVATDVVEVRDGEVVIRDTESLTTDQKAAIAGIKEGRAGIEIKMHDKVRALELLCRNLGLLDKKEEQEGQGVTVVINGEAQAWSE